MGREIKFRAWDKHYKKMRSVKGLSFDYCRETGIKGEEIGIVLGIPYEDELSIDNRKEPLGVHRDAQQVATHILMQYTGLKDKNGKEIYEGDIVATENQNYGYGDPTQKPMIYLLIAWDNLHACFNCGCNDIGCDNFGMYHEVVGNIHENPELLEAGGGE